MEENNLKISLSLYVRLELNVLYHLWYLINAILGVEPICNYLLVICLYMNFNEDIRNKKKGRKLRGVSSI